MDQSVETFIKMCDCPEIQGLWDKSDTDLVVSYGEDRTIDDWRWVPSLEHLLDIGCDGPEPWQVIYPLHKWFNNRFDDYPSQFVSMKQLCLAFVMLKKFSKVWNWDSSGWVVATQGGA